MRHGTLVDGTGSNFFFFNTKSAAGAPITLAGAPSLAANINGGAAAVAGLTLSVDHGGVTGKHRVAVDVDDATLALVDGDVIEIYIAAGTVDAISVVGTIIGVFTITNGTLLAQTKADINAEVVDALNVDTYAEPGQGTPGATISLAQKIGYIFKAWRNRTTQTATEYAVYGDDGVTKHHEAPVSDNGVTFERSEVTTGA